MSYKHAHGVKTNKHPYIRILLGGLLVLLGGVSIVSQLIVNHHSPLVKPAPVAMVMTGEPKASVNYALPVRLQIPKLLVDAPVINEGLTKDGNMNVPANVIDTGWYKYGALPGSQGTAVIAGHLDGLRGEPGVFRNLNKLVVGDTLTVTESNGLAVSFTVRETRSYALNAQPSEVFRSTSGSHVNLITCTGSWDSSEHRFSQRLVIFADKAS